MSDLGPTLYAGSSLSTDASQTPVTVVNDREIAIGRDHRWRVYTQGDFTFADVDSTGSSTGYEGETYAATAGVEYW